MWKRLLGDWLSPPSCAGCDAKVPSANVFCGGCAATVTTFGDEAHEVLAFGAFGGALAVALRRFKYENRPDLGRPLGELLRGVCRRRRIEADVVIPVPLHPKRLADRGYNQALLLARSVARETGGRVHARALRRRVDTPRQAELPRDARLENVARAFALHTPDLMTGKRVLLVDDVSTTGATLRACAQTLSVAHPASIRALVVARTLELG